MNIAPLAEKKAFTKSVVQSSFNNTGIQPFDAKKILEKTRLNIAELNNTSNKAVNTVEEKVNKLQYHYQKAVPLILLQSQLEPKLSEIRSILLKI